MEDTIFALSSPAGGAIAVVRISGPEAAGVLRRVFTGRVEHRHMAYGRVVSGGQTLDECMAALILGPHSYTGEDMAELYCHGGHAVVQAVLGLLSQHARAALPGEFSQRAFLNGRMDLARAEAVMDLINAEAASSARAALRQLQGELSRAVAGLEEGLVAALSGINAAIDYPEELDEDVHGGLPAQLQGVLAGLQSLVEDGLRGRVLREGAGVVLVGRPNAGKSSLLNALLGRERAIVTAAPGTTRDVLEEGAVLSGVPVRLLDTAGMRPAQDEAEAQGVQRAKAAMEAADLLLVVLDGSCPLTAEDGAVLAQTAGRERLVVLAKADLAQVLDPGEFIGSVAVSAKTGAGVEQLKAGIAARLRPAESALVTNARHIEALQEAACAVKSALDAACALGAAGAELAATDIRAALLALGRITGTAVDEKVIEQIFARFCVGK